MFGFCRLIVASGILHIFVNTLLRVGRDILIVHKVGCHGYVEGHGVGVFHNQRGVVLCHCTAFVVNFCVDYEVQFSGHVVCGFCRGSAQCECVSAYRAVNFHAVRIKQACFQVYCALL